MLERLTNEAYESISKPSKVVQRLVSEKLNELGSINYGEFGVGIGATTLSIAKLMQNQGELHLFDFERRVLELANDLKNLGFENVVAHSNTEKHWDSYHWSLSKLIRQGYGEFLDVIYIDGAHTYLHDALIFFMCDRVLKVGGIIVFDDWYWSFANSKWMADIRDQFMTEEQACSRQIKMFLEELVNNHIGYEQVEKLTVYRKIRRTTNESANWSDSTKQACTD